jgi:hypothetical protein
LFKVLTIYSIYANIRGVKEKQKMPKYESSPEVEYSDPNANRVRAERQLALKAMQASDVVSVPRDVMMGIENRAQGVESHINGAHKVPTEQTSTEHKIVVHTPNNEHLL